MTDLLAELPLLGRQPLVGRLQRVCVCFRSSRRLGCLLSLLLLRLRQPAQLLRHLLRLRGFTALLLQRLRWSRNNTPHAECRRECSTP